MSKDSLGDAEFGEDEGVVEGDFFEVVVAAACAAVACAHVGFEEEDIAVGFEGAEFCGVFGGFPVHDLAVVEASLEEHGGIVFAVEACVWAIIFYVEVIFGALGIAPLFVFADGKRESGIEHGVEDVDEGDVANDGAEEVGAKIGDCAHQEAAGAAAFDDEFVSRRKAQRDQIFGTSDEIGEGIHLAVHAASVVPGLAEFAATTDVGDGEDYTAIEKAQAIGTEADGHGKAVAAVAVKKQGRAAIAGSGVAIDDGDGNFGAVGGDGVETFAGVESGMGAAEEGLRLA